MVETFELTKEFRDHKGGKVVALDGVSITAQPGKITGILGVNGAGKTSLLRILSTVINPTSGRATVAGFDVYDHPQQVRERIGFMSTSTALYGRLTAREMLEYFASLYRIPADRIKNEVDRVVETFHIAEFADRLCDKLSTGQKQRVSIARTILHDPEVLFFDEPTAGLDVVTSQIVMKFVADIKSRGKTVVYCTHIMSEAEKICDHLEVIHEGRVLSSGSVEQIKTSSGRSDLESAFLHLVGAEVAI